MHPTVPQQTSEQAQRLREQAEQIRERAQELRERAERQREEAERHREQAEADREAAQTIRIPMPPMPPHEGIVIQGPRPWEHDRAIPDEVVDIVGMLTAGTAAVLILRPLMRAFANRFERRGAPALLPPEVSAHMERLEQAIDAVAIEVERISEGQRYTTKLLSERAGKQG